MRRASLLALTPVLAGGMVLAMARYLAAIAMNPDRALRIAIGTDQLVNAAGNGSEDETISSRADRAREEGRRWGCVLCGLLDWIEKDHCKNARGT